MTRFDDCHAVTHRWERGYSDHPRDPGGATQDGVTQRVYTAWRRGQGLEDQPVRRSTEGERASIFRAQYWQAVRGDDLPAGIDLAVYDFAVNSGPARAIRYLQSALGVVTDGHIGAVTIRAARDAAERGEAAAVVQRIMDGRRAFLRGLSTFDVFGKGWTNRLDDVGKAARQMAQAPGRTPARVRPPAPADAYRPDKAAPAPPSPAGMAEKASQVAVTVGAAGGAAAAAAGQTKELFGDMLGPGWLAGAVIVVMIAAGIVALLAARKARAAE